MPEQASLQRQLTECRQQYDAAMSDAADALTANQFVRARDACVRARNACPLCEEVRRVGRRVDTAHKQYLRHRTKRRAQLRQAAVWLAVAIGAAALVTGISVCLALIF